MSVSSPLSPFTPLCLESNKFTFEQVRPHHYLIRVFKMLKCSLLLPVMSLVVLGALIITSVRGAPVFTVHTQRSAINIDDDLDTNFVLPSPPTAREVREASNPNSTPVPTAPLKLPFIKNSQCSLHIPGGETTAKMCGLRQLDVANGESGIKSWKPSRCRPFHCNCVPTKEVHRMKRTIADNKTTVEFHRFRVFECV